MGESPPKCPLRHVISLTRLIAVHFVVLHSLLLVFMRGGSTFQVVRSKTFSGTSSVCPFGRMLNNMGLRPTDNSNSRYGGSYSEGRLGSQSRTMGKGTHDGKVMKRGKLICIEWSGFFTLTT